ncbi:hypothetical protein [Desulfogranum japonicum]|uniref:hypothetical protein n=1 Tax=Desulfogranum japonicum TaxID=231447 RepID=UPI000410851F|nr:hypothetical protein [Desulfogranum japonicum]
MTIQVLKKQDAKVDIGHETSKFSLTIVMAMAALVSIWAVACLFGGLMSGGVGTIIKGYITAVFG